MKLPLMLTQNGLPPAQAEALCETLPPGSQDYSSAEDLSTWPGEDWEEADSPLFPRVRHSLTAAPFPRQAFRSPGQR